MRQKSYAGKFFKNSLYLLYGLTICSPLQLYHSQTHTHFVTPPICFITEGVSPASLCPQQKIPPHCAKQKVSNRNREAPKPNILKNCFQAKVCHMNFHSQSAAQNWLRNRQTDPFTGAPNTEGFHSIGLVTLKNVFTF